MEVSNLRTKLSGLDKKHKQTRKDLKSTKMQIENLQAIIKSTNEAKAQFKIRAVYLLFLLLSVTCSFGFGFLSMRFFGFEMIDIVGIILTITIAIGVFGVSHWLLGFWSKDKKELTSWIFHLKITGFRKWFFGVFVLGILIGQVSSHIDDLKRQKKDKIEKKHSELLKDISNQKIINKWRRE
ncbi:MAG: hypothetical protein MI922_00875 [Bacteroidales bacterium]|nr:hypothetical protein [Bacteroidales bacterium]